MAKRKKRKEEKSKKFPYTNELYGLALILLSILGIGMNKPLGLVGRLARAFSTFLVGSWDLVFLAACFILGGYLLIKREVPKFLTSRMIGVYILIIGILVFSHLSYVELNGGNSIEIFKETLNTLMSNFDLIMHDVSFTPSGGGILGCGFAVLFNKLFDYSGTKIVAIVLMIAGGCLFTGVSIIDIIKNALKKGKKLLPGRKNSIESSDDDEAVEPAVIINDNTSNKMVVSSIDELTKAKEEVKQEETNANPITEVVQNSNYKLPSLNLLSPPKKTKSGTNQTAIENNIVTLERVLKDFGINGKVVEVNIGPTVTQYELSLSSGTRVSKLLTINKEISLALAKKDVRIQAPIPGKSTVGIEMPNDSTQAVTIRETLEQMPSSLNNKPLAVALGKDIMGKVRWCEIDKTPHLLVAGATGSGKSVCINTMLISILMKARPDEVKLVMVDPKKVELGIYNGIPHLLTPVVTDPKKASIALKRAVSEMDRRYDLFEEFGTKNITGYNALVEEKNKKLPDDEKLAKMPYIVVIVDELADLMLVAGKEVEDSIMRITQMARAAGIHLIIATQRPSTEVITGLIKSNIPSRIAFAVSSSINSRTILDMGGAEKLLGKGDMLFLPMGENSPERIQGAFIDESEIKKVVDHTIAQQKASFDQNFMNLENVDAEIKENTISNDKEEYDDPLYNDIVEFVITQGKASASLLQRRFKLGYNRAARIVDLLEERGIIGPQNGSKPREVLVKLESQDEE